MDLETLKAAWEAATAIKKFESAINTLSDRATKVTITARVDEVQGNEFRNLRFVDISRDLIGILSPAAEAEVDNMMRDALLFILERELTYAQNRLDSL